MPFPGISFTLLDRPLVTRDQTFPFCLYSTQHTHTHRTRANTRSHQPYPPTSPITTPPLKNPTSYLNRQDARLAIPRISTSINKDKSQMAIQRTNRRSCNESRPARGFDGFHWFSYNLPTMDGAKCQELLCI